MNQSQEEIAVIGIFALLWVGECRRVAGHDRQMLSMTLSPSVPCRIQVAHWWQCRVKHCEQHQYIRAGIERVRELAGSV